MPNEDASRTERARLEIFVTCMSAIIDTAERHSNSLGMRGLAQARQDMIKTKGIVWTKAVGKHRTIYSSVDSLGRGTTVFEPPAGVNEADMIDWKLRDSNEATVNHLLDLRAKLAQFEMNEADRTELDLQLSATLRAVQRNYGDLVLRSSIAEVANRYLAASSPYEIVDSYFDAVAQITALRAGAAADSRLILVAALMHWTVQDLHSAAVAQGRDEAEINTLDLEAISITAGPYSYGNLETEEQGYILVFHYCQRSSMRSFIDGFIDSQMNDGLEFVEQALDQKNWMKFCNLIFAAGTSLLLAWRASFVATSVARELGQYDNYERELGKLLHFLEERVVRCLVSLDSVLGNSLDSGIRGWAQEIAELAEARGPAEAELAVDDAIENQYLFPRAAKSQLLRGSLDR